MNYTFLAEKEKLITEEKNIFPYKLYIEIYADDDMEARKYVKAVLPDFYTIKIVGVK